MQELDVNCQLIHLLKMLVDAIHPVIADISSDARWDSEEGGCPSDGGPWNLRSKYEVRWENRCFIELGQ